MNSERRSVLIAVVGGMMAAAYMDSEGIVDLSFGFPRDSIAQGALLAAAGGVVGYLVLLVFRTLRDFATRGRK